MVVYRASLSKWMRMFRNTSTLHLTQVPRPGGSASTTVSLHQWNTSVAVFILYRIETLDCSAPTLTNLLLMDGTCCTLQVMLMLRSLSDCGDSCTPQIQKSRQFSIKCHLTHCNITDCCCHGWLSAADAWRPKASDLRHPAWFVNVTVRRLFTQPTVKP